MSGHEMSGHEMIITELRCGVSQFPTFRSRTRRESTCSTPS